ncbi:MAG: hypothetical protein R2750_06560 [Bacteroidales bacterium]
MQLLRTILIIIIVYYLFKLFVRYVMPYIARYFIRRTVRNFENQHQSQQSPGEINVEKTPPKKKPLDDLGEYVDYEEINDKK